MCVLASLTACVTSAKPQRIELSYPHANVDYAGIANLRGLAARVAPYYATVLILDNAPRTGGDSASIINGASGIVIDDSGSLLPQPISPATARW